jgi:hypothetical protein
MYKDIFRKIYNIFVFISTLFNENGHLIIIHIILKNGQKDKFFDKRAVEL